jgi:hypothetical protein
MGLGLISSLVDEKKEKRQSLTMPILYSLDFYQQEKIMALMEFLKSECFIF